MIDNNPAPDRAEVTPAEVEVTIGQIGRAHGIRGDVAIEVRTDEPDRRFAPGSVVLAEEHGRLTIEHTRWHSGRLLASFSEVSDRTAAEALRGAQLSVLVPADEAPEDEEEFYDRQLIGLMAHTVEGAVVGPVVTVVHLGEQDLLVIDVDGAERLVPFVSELVPTVDLRGGRVIINPIPGLLHDEVDDDGAEVADVR